MTERRILLDTGPLVALLAAIRQPPSTLCRYVRQARPPLLTCWPVLTEAAWLLRKQTRPIDRLADAHTAGMFALLPLDGDSLTAIAAIMRATRMPASSSPTPPSPISPSGKTSAPSSPRTAGISRSSASNATGCSSCCRRSNERHHPPARRAHPGVPRRRARRSPRADHARGESNGGRIEWGQPLFPGARHWVALSAELGIS